MEHILSSQLLVPRTWSLHVKVYAGGAFTGGVARWDPRSKNWLSMGDGLAGDVRALVVAKGDLYVGGNFDTVKNPNGTAFPLGGLAKWDGSTWSRVRNIEGHVDAMALAGDSLWIAGDFSPNQPLGTTSVATIDLSSGVVTVLGQANGAIATIAPIRGGVVIGGGFSSIAGVSAFGLARFDVGSSKWESIGNISGELGPCVKAALEFVGGFDFAGSGSFGGVARYHAPDGSFHPLGGGICSTSDFKQYNTSFAVARAIALLDGSVYVGGHFNGAVN